jgi:hypothetical protein
MLKGPTPSSQDVVAVVELLEEKDEHQQHLQ